jgi:hypothetical protein
MGQQKTPDGALHLTASLLQSSPDASICFILQLPASAAGGRLADAGNSTELPPSRPAVAPRSSPAPVVPRMAHSPRSSLVPALPRAALSPGSSPGCWGGRAGTTAPLAVRFGEVVGRRSRRGAHLPGVGPRFELAYGGTTTHCTTAREVG